ncbi:hypothetical protein ES708_26878 [subsurface metagenome]
MGDYPDYTELMQIIGSDIMIPMDIQAAYIMMPVDIQAQYVTLDINIKAKEVTLTIDIEAQHVGVYLQPDWNIFKGYGKAWNILGSNVATDGTLNQDYTPSGKTLYITHVSAVMFGYANEDKDKDQVFELVVAGVYMGGNGGCQLALITPIKIADGVPISMTMYNRANHACNMRLSVKGYLI